MFAKRCKHIDYGPIAKLISLTDVISDLMNVTIHERTNELY